MIKFNSHPSISCYGLFESGISPSHPVLPTSGIVLGVTISPPWTDIAKWGPGEGRLRVEVERVHVDHWQVRRGITSERVRQLDSSCTVRPCTRRWLPSIWR